VCSHSVISLALLLLLYHTKSTRFCGIYLQLLCTHQPKRVSTSGVWQQAQVYDVRDLWLDEAILFWLLFEPETFRSSFQPRRKKILSNKEEEKGGLQGIKISMLPSWIASCSFFEQQTVLGLLSQGIPILLRVATGLNVIMMLGASNKQGGNKCAFTTLLL